MRNVVRDGLRLSLGGLLLLGLSGCASAPVPRPVAPLVSSGRGPSMALPLNTVVVDAGHGGHDPGTSHFGLKEKHLALDIAKRLRAQLEEAGLKVVMTRQTDQFIPLSGRPGLANRLHADLFVSIHINANRNRRVSGIEVYYPRESVVSSSAQWPPSVTENEVAIPSTTVKQVLWDLVLGRTRSHAHRLASSICRSMRTQLQVSSRGTKPARFVVLREAWMPAVLVEVGYVSNEVEAGRLGSPTYRQAIAESIGEGVVSYIRDASAQGRL